MHEKSSVVDYCRIITDGTCAGCNVQCFMIANAHGPILCVVPLPYMWMFPTFVSLVFVPVFEHVDLVEILVLPHH